MLSMQVFFRGGGGGGGGVEGNKGREGRVGDKLALVLSSCSQQPSSSLLTIILFL